MSTMDVMKPVLSASNEKLVENTSATATTIVTTSGTAVLASVNSTTTTITQLTTIKGKLPPKPPEEFYKDLQQFHERRGTPITHQPKISGRIINLHQLYSEVTERGGFLKVNARDEWEEILPVLGLREKCVNASAAMKHLYRRYLEKYERLNFFGEDPDKMEALEAIDPLESGGRSRSRYPLILHNNNSSIVNTVPMSYNYRQHIVNMDRRRMFKLSTDLHKPSPLEKLMLSLISPLPNEQDFAINACILMSNETKSTLKLNEYPKLLNVLLAHTGVFSDYSLRKLFQHTYNDIRRHSLYGFWRDLLYEKPQILDMYTDEQALRDAALIDNTEDLTLTKDLTRLKQYYDDGEFFNLGRGKGTQEFVGQRIQQVVGILRNLSFFEENVPVFAQNRTFLRFLVMSANIRWGTIHNQALDIAGNVATEIALLDPSTDDVSRNFMITLCEGIESSDRGVIINSLEVLHKLCQNDANEEHVQKCLNLKFYETICLYLSLNDIMLLIFTLEAIYALTSLGARTCHLIMQVRGVVDQLVSLITVEAQSYGRDGCILMRVVETVPGNMLPIVAQNIANFQNVAVLQKQQQQQQQQQHLHTQHANVALPSMTQQPPQPQPQPQQQTYFQHGDLQQQQVPQHVGDTMSQQQQQQPTSAIVQVAPQQQQQQQQFQHVPPLPQQQQQQQQSAQEQPIATTAMQHQPQQQQQPPPSPLPQVQQQQQQQQQQTHSTQIMQASSSCTHDDEQYALAWLSATFELANSNESRVEQQELYRMYLVHCQKSGKHSVVNSLQFPRLVRLIFNTGVGPVIVRRPDGTELPGLHYVAIRVRAQPLPIQGKSTQILQKNNSPLLVAGSDSKSLKTTCELQTTRKTKKKKLQTEHQPAASPPQQQQQQQQSIEMKDAISSEQQKGSEHTKIEVPEIPRTEDSSIGSTTKDFPKFAAAQHPVTVQHQQMMTSAVSDAPQQHIQLQQQPTQQPQQQQQPSSSVIKSLLANKVTQRQQKQKDLNATTSNAIQSGVHGNILITPSGTGNNNNNTNTNVLQQGQQQPIKVASTVISALVNNPLMQNTPVKVGQTTIKPLNPQMSYDKKSIADSTPPPLAPLSGSNVTKDVSGRPVIIANQMLVEMLDKKANDPPIPATIVKRKLDENINTDVISNKRLSLDTRKDEPSEVAPSKNAANLYAEFAASLLEDEELDDVVMPTTNINNPPMEQMAPQAPPQPPPPTPTLPQPQQSLIIPGKLPTSGATIQRQLVFQTNQPGQLKLASGGTQHIPTAMATIKTDQGLQTVPVILQQKPLEATQPQLIQQVIQQTAQPAPAPQPTQYVLATNQQGQTYLVAQQAPQPPPPPPPTQTVLVTQTPQQQSTGAKTIIILQQQSLPNVSVAQAVPPQIISTGGPAGTQKMLMTTAQGQQLLVTQRPSQATTPHPATQQIIINSQTGTATHIQHVPVSNAQSAATANLLQRQLVPGIQQSPMGPATQTPAGQISPSLLSQLNHIPATIKLHQPGQHLTSSTTPSGMPHSATISRLGKSVSIVQTTPSAPIQIPQLQQHQSIIQQHIISGPSEKRQVLLGGRTIEIKETVITQTHPPPQQSQLNSQTIITKQPTSVAMIQQQQQQQHQQQPQHQHPQHQHQQHSTQQIRAVIEQQQQQQQQSHASIVQQKIQLPQTTTTTNTMHSGNKLHMESTNLIHPTTLQTKSLPQAQAVVQTILPQAIVTQATITGTTTPTIKKPLPHVSVQMKTHQHQHQQQQPNAILTVKGNNNNNNNAGPPPLAVATTTATTTATIVSRQYQHQQQQQPEQVKEHKIEEKSVMTTAPMKAPINTTTTTNINIGNITTNLTTTTAQSTVAITPATASVQIATTTTSAQSNAATATQNPQQQQQVSQSAPLQQTQQQQLPPPLPPHQQQQQPQQQQLSTIDPNWLYICDWRNCPRRKFKSISDLQQHACTAHCPDHLDPAAEIFCQWGAGPGLCDGIPRKRYSLMTHLIDRHTIMESLRSAVQRRIATGTSNLQPTQSPVTIVRNVDQSQRNNTASPASSSSSSSNSPSNTTGTSAIAAIKRHTADFVNSKELMDENEGPVTKSIRLTAALILRNLVTYTSTAKRTLRRYEPHLANVALSNVESSGIISHILFELNN